MIDHEAEITGGSPFETNPKAVIEALARLADTSSGDGWAVSVSTELQGVPFSLSAGTDPEQAYKAWSTVKSHHSD
jgi:hypothetical protein